MLRFHRNHRARYAGEYAPNVFSAWDEYQRGDNEEGYQAEVASMKAKYPEISPWVELTIEVNEDTILDAMYPARKITDSTLVEAVPSPLEPLRS